MDELNARLTDFTLDAEDNHSGIYGSLKYLVNDSFILNRKRYYKQKKTVEPTKN